MHAYVVVVLMRWEQSRFRQSANIVLQRLVWPNHPNHHQSGLWHHPLSEWYSDHVHVWLWTVLAGQESRPTGSIRSCLSPILRWEGQRPLLLHYCGNTCWLLCSANGATTRLCRCHSCSTSRQPGGRRRGSPLGHRTSSLGSPWGCSFPALDQQQTKTQQIGCTYTNNLLWPRSLQDVNLKRNDVLVAVHLHLWSQQ